MILSGASMKKKIGVEWNLYHVSVTVSTLWLHNFNEISKAQYFINNSNKKKAANEKERQKSVYVIFFKRVKVVKRFSSEHITTPQLNSHSSSMNVRTVFFFSTYSLDNIQAHIHTIIYPYYTMRPISHIYRTQIKLFFPFSNKLFFSVFSHKQHPSL